ncbi:hypothetical protein [Pseudomonas aeruginosa]|uniref:hypothetical protein n=1 Tax=Pseudomonas aeruginosa TaxID=287 RepID=UPI001CA5D90C|nr:hypothetical protein [Pseudomonas aeruginosa]MBW6069682.1 hypothetical protein [Pseudomonas aeruginosa]
MREFRTGQYCITKMDIPHPKPNALTGPTYLTAGQQCQIIVYDPSKTPSTGIRKEGENFAMVYVDESVLIADPSKPVPTL